jgi:hypothetical protein
LILVRLFIGADLGDIVDLAGIPDQDLSRAGGLWVAAIGACIAATGAVIKIQAEGGSVGALTDLQRLRDGFKS